MNLESTKLLTKWRLFYFQYKEFFTPVGIIVVCVILFLFVVMPQIDGFLSSQSQLSNDQEKLHVLQQNFQQITNFNNQQLEQFYSVTISALPVEKNGIAILNSLSHAASVTNISLRDYNFSVGSITPLTNEPPVEILLAVNGDMIGIQKFIHEIESSLPLAAITEVNAPSSTSASLTIDFYTKSSFKPNIDPNQPIQLLTKQQENLINKLSSWQNNANTTQ